MPDLELATGILLDEDNRMLVAHRADHQQWELPGGKLLAGSIEGIEQPLDEAELAFLSLQWAFKRKLNLDISRDGLIELGAADFNQGGVTYRTHWLQIREVQQRKRVSEVTDVISLSESVYDDIAFVSPLSRNFLRKPSSPNIRNLQRALINRTVELRFHPLDIV